MHAEVMTYLRSWAGRYPAIFDALNPETPVIEFGAQDMNGSARDVVRGGKSPEGHYIGIDPICAPGTRGVQVQACAHEVRLIQPAPHIRHPLAPGWDLTGRFSASVPYLPVRAMPGGEDVAAADLRRVRLVISTEVLEHDPHWIATICNAVHHLRDQGLFIFTLATGDRLVHGLDSCTPERGYYRNLSPAEIRYALGIAACLSGCRVEVLDLRVIRHNRDLQGIIRVHRPAEPPPRPRLLLGRSTASLSAFLSGPVAL